MRLNLEDIRKLTLWLAFVWASVSPLAIIAQPSAGQLSVKFRPVLNREEITADGAYLVGAEYASSVNGQEVSGLCVLTNLGGHSTLLGAEIPVDYTSVIEIANDCCIWHLKNDGALYTLYSPSAKQGVALKKKSSSSLVMSAGDWEKWELTTLDEGVFELKSQSDNSRVLGLNWYNTSKSYFGLYKSSGSYSTKLRIFKQIVNAADLPGKATMPANGSHIGLVVKDRVLVSKISGADFKDVSPFMLEDNTLAADSSLLTWICLHGANGIFRLQTSEGKGLETIVKGLPAEMDWKVDNGHVITAETPARFLVQTDNDQLTLMSREEVEEKNPDFVLFVSIGDTPDSTLDKQGVKILKGSWSAGQLAEVDWDKVQILDLTKIPLPASVVQFSRRPENSNTLVYVSADTKMDYWDTWKNVVICSADGSASWSHPAELIDREPWYVDRDIRTSSRQLVYQRQAYADGNWETIMLPFDASLPADFELAELEKRGENGNLIFKKAKSIVANEPMIIRYIGAATDGRVNLELYNQEGWLKPYLPAKSLLSGTYFPLNVTAEQNGIYLLNANGDTFVRAAAGSYLAPFRAAFFENTNRSAVRLTFADEEVTGILQTENERTGRPCYSTDGRLITSSLCEEDWQRLPKGAYIIGGKKYLK